MVRARTLLLAALLPALAAYVVVLNRHQLLKVPKIGFVLYALAGGEVPPYFDTSILKRHKEWLNPGDVIATVPAKSGTTWSMYTLHLLRSRGKPAPFRDIYEEVPWAEIVYYPGQTVDERIEHIRNVSRRYPFNIIKTHASTPQVPYREDLKYVITIRNLYDAVASLRPFFQGHTAEYAKIWGGFPPDAGKAEVTPDAEWEHALVKDGGNGEPLVKPFALDVLVNWWPYRNRSNVLFIHYSDRLNNDEEQIQRMAKLLDIELSPDEIKGIAKLCTFEEMKKIGNKMEARYMMASYEARGLVPKGLTMLEVSDDSVMLNKGSTRQGVSEITPSLRAGLTEIMKSNLHPEVMRWLLYGGRFPAEVEIK